MFDKFLCYLKLMKSFRYWTVFWSRLFSPNIAWHTRASTKAIQITDVPWKLAIMSNRNLFRSTYQELENSLLILTKDFNRFIWDLRVQVIAQHWIWFDKYLHSFSWSVIYFPIDYFYLPLSITIPACFSFSF